ncbi:MAG TPA: CaiB/BaiF CoA-transferase family protein [Candidatus Eisenbacteria bacterium]|nr:CaiB/BaiF CoA-transferase family protein [Candidatus Eisenbacteria bacterium]
MGLPPLHRYRMLDLSRQLPGPFCSTLLADLGMDVLTITAPNDPFATGIPFLARNKRSMTLNLKAPGGRELFVRLARDADVVLEGFRPGVAARLGIDYETLRRDNPRLVYCAISGYGQDGPYRDRVGHDVNYLAQAGVLEYVGEAGRAPVIPGVQIADIGAGSLMAAVGILSALIARETTGSGQLVDVAMLDGAAAWNVYHTVLYLFSGTLPTRGREQLTGHFPCYAVYETADGRHLTIGAYEGHFWATLCRHFGREDFVALQWAEGEERTRMFAFFRDAFRKKTLAAWTAELGALDICYAPVATLEEAFADPQLRHRGMVVEMQTPAGPTRFFGPPISLSDTPASIRTPPATLGAHTDDVLTSLGLDPTAIATLRKNGVV